MARAHGGLRQVVRLGLSPQWPKDTVSLPQSLPVQVRSCTVPRSVTETVELPPACAGSPTGARTCASIMGRGAKMGGVVPDSSKCSETMEKPRKCKFVAMSEALSTNALDT